jgi:hypothetical protein
MRHLECSATNKNDGDLHGDLYNAGHDSSSNGEKLNSPMMVMTIKNQWLSMQSSRSEFTELEIWAKTNVLKTTV